MLALPHPYLSMLAIPQAKSRKHWFQFHCRLHSAYTQISQTMNQLHLDLSIFLVCIPYCSLLKKKSRQRTVGDLRYFRSFFSLKKYYEVIKSRRLWIESRCSVVLRLLAPSAKCRHLLLMRFRLQREREQGVNAEGDSLYSTSPIHWEVSMPTRASASTYFKWQMPALHLRKQEEKNDTAAF